MLFWLTLKFHNTELPFDLELNFSKIKEFFPNGGKGIAILIGQFNNTPVNGTVLFEQNV
jgi:hypothetical protein